MPIVNQCLSTKALPLKSALCSIILLLSACTVGPDYQRPSTPIDADFKELKGWKPARPRDEQLQGQWWQVFNDAELNGLVEQVGKKNQSLAQAEAQFRQAQAVVQGASAGYFPIVNVSASANRFRAATGQSVAVSGVRNLFGAALSIAWEPDLWGAVRRQVESDQSAAQASFATWQALKLSTQATLVQTYFQLRTLDAQQHILNDTLAAYAKSLEITQNRYAVGVAAQAEVLQAQTQLEALKAQSVNLGVQRSRLEHALAVLIGATPSSVTLTSGALPTALPAVPVSVPSQVLERRPDIAGAERQITAANAKIGIAKAAYFPTVTLSATNGVQSRTISNLIDTAARYWALGPIAFALPLFDGGAKAAKMAEAEAVYDASIAAYRQTVLTAFQEVEDNLSALRILEEESAVQARTVEYARKSLALTLNQYKAGTVSYLNVMTAQSTLLDAEQIANDLLGQRFNACVLLIKALGGGWRPADLPSLDDIGGDPTWSQFLPIPLGR